MNIISHINRISRRSKRFVLSTLSFPFLVKLHWEKFIDFITRVTFSITLFLEKNHAWKILSLYSIMPNDFFLFVCFYSKRTEELNDMTIILYLEHSYSSKFYWSMPIHILNIKLLVMINYRPKVHRFSWTWYIAVLMISLLQFRMSSSSLTLRSSWNFSNLSPAGFEYGTFMICIPSFNHYSTGATVKKKKYYDLHQFTSDIERIDIYRKMGWID